MKNGNIFAKRYLEIQNELKTLEAEKSVLSALFKQNGSFTTVDYVVAIQARSQTRLAGLETVCMFYPRAELEARALIKTSEFQQAVVAEKRSTISLDDIATEIILPNQEQLNKRKA